MSDPELTPAQRAEVDNLRNFAQSQQLAADEARLLGHADRAFDCNLRAEHARLRVETLLEKVRQLQLKNAATAHRIFSSVNAPMAVMLLLMGLLFTPGCAAIGGNKTAVSPPSAKIVGQAQSTGEGEHAAFTVSAPSPVYNVFVGTAAHLPEAALTAPTAGSATPTTFTLNGNTFSAPAGSAVAIHYDRTPATSATTQTGDFQGAGLVTNSASGANGFSTAAPEVNMPGLAVTKGGGSIWNFKDIPARPENVLFYAIGLLFIIVAAVDAWFTENLKAAGVIAAVGLFIIGIGVVINVYPWLFAWGIALACVGAVGYGVYWWLVHKKTTALPTVDATNTGWLRTATGNIGHNLESILYNRKPDESATATTPTPPESSPGIK